MPQWSSLRVRAWNPFRNFVTGKPDGSQIWRCLRRQPRHPGVRQQDSLAREILGTHSSLAQPASHIRTHAAQMNRSSSSVKRRWPGDRMKASVARPMERRREIVLAYLSRAAASRSHVAHRPIQQGPVKRIEMRQHRRDLRQEGIAHDRGNLFFASAARVTD